jgi:8-oxo-dGTP pyrophosphatase MutT (NUDIX family)
MPHINEKIDFVVSAFIVYKRKVLLIDHKQLKLWLPIGGHIELDEDPEEALFREIEEECGLGVEINAEKPDVVSPGTKWLYRPEYLDIHNINDSHKHMAFTYFLKANSDKVRLAELEHNQIKWFTKDELEEERYQIRPAVKFFARSALEKLAW